MQENPYTRPPADTLGEAVSRLRGFVAHVDPREYDTPRDELIIEEGRDALAADLRRVLDAAESAAR